MRTRQTENINERKKNTCFYKTLIKCINNSMVSNLEVQYTRFFSVLRHKMYAPTFFSKVELISSIQNVSKKKKNLFVKFEKKLFFWVDSYVIVKVNIPGACLAKRTEFRHCKFVFGIVDF